MATKKKGRQLGLRFPAEPIHTRRPVAPVSVPPPLAPDPVPTHLLSDEFCSFGFIPHPESLERIKLILEMSKNLKTQ